MKRVSLFLSPHLDDAVFSCAAQILAEVARGRRVVVATLFSAGCVRTYRLRRSEDREAMEMLGAEPLWLDLPDAPFRNRFYRSFRTIIFGTAKSDHRFVDHVASRSRPSLRGIAAGDGSCPTRGRHTYRSSTDLRRRDPHGKIGTPLLRGPALMHSSSRRFRYGSPRSV
jgi:LmbE family N-acetylglucosaminyl deacetylase